MSQSTAPDTTTGKYHKAIIGAIAGGLVAALSTITGAMTIEQTLGDIPTVIWLSALLSFLVGSGVTGSAVAVSKANAPGPVDPNEDTPTIVRDGTASGTTPPYPHLEP